MRAVSSQQPHQTAEDHLLALIPEDGRAIGNTELRRRLGWDEADYWSVRNGLIDGGVLEKGRGKGGSVRRVTSVAEGAPSAAEEVVAEVAEERARLYEQETALYGPMRAVIETDWAKDRRVNPIAVEITAAQGRRMTGGRWSRPDIVSVSVQAFVHLPAGRFIEVTTFEVKPTDDIDVLAVYEALAHRRAATHSYVLLHVPEAEQPPLQERINEICEVARFHGIGVIVADDPSNYETWEEREAASRVEPDPARLDRFIATQLQGATKIAQAVR